MQLLIWSSENSVIVIGSVIVSGTVALRAYFLNSLILVNRYAEDLAAIDLSVFLSDGYSSNISPEALGGTWMLLEKGFPPRVASVMRLALGNEAVSLVTAFLPT